MSVAVERGERTRARPGAVRATLWLLGFLGISAIPGALALGWDFADGQPPGEWLASIPLVDSWTLPALVLGIGFGLGSLVVAYGVLRLPAWEWLRPVEELAGHHWSWLATLLVGSGHAAWIGLELVYLPAPSWLQAVYGAVALGLLGLPLLPTARHYFRTSRPGPP